MVRANVAYMVRDRLAQRRELKAWAQCSGETYTQSETALTGISVSDRLKHQ